MHTTLHALCTIVKKIVHLYVGFEWKLEPYEAKKNAIKIIKKILSEIGLHGGKAFIEKDLNKVGTRSNGTYNLDPLSFYGKIRK